MLTNVVLLAMVLAEPMPTPASDLGPRVSRASYDGVIVTERDPDEWTPSVSEVEKLEGSLLGYVRARRKDVGRLRRPLFEYKRQYIGWRDRGKRLIIVTFFHRSSDIVASGQWLRVLTTVAGGGDTFLSARYDADSARFVEFNVNAPE